MYTREYVHTYIMYTREYATHSIEERFEQIVEYE